MKYKIYNFFKPYAVSFFSLFYDKNYLTGKHFDNNIQGWRWVLRGMFFQKILRINCKVPWPCSPFILVQSPENIHFHPDELNNFQTIGNFFQASPNSRIHIGRNVWIAPNVLINTTTRDFKDPSKHKKYADVIINDNCWIGMNSSILAGVVLGSNTIVGAGSVVTKSFPEGNVLIGGNPAKVISTIDTSCIA